MDNNQEKKSDVPAQSWGCLSIPGGPGYVPPTTLVSFVQRQFEEWHTAAPVPAPVPALAAPVPAFSAPERKKKQAPRSHGKGKVASITWALEETAYLLEHRTRADVLAHSVIGEHIGRTAQACRLRLLEFRKALGHSGFEQERTSAWARLKPCERELARDFDKKCKAADKASGGPKRKRSSTKSGAAEKKTCSSSKKRKVIASSAEPSPATSLDESAREQHASTLLEEIPAAEMPSTAEQEEVVAWDVARFHQFPS